MNHSSHNKHKKAASIPLGKLYDSFEETKALIRQTNNIWQSCSSILLKYQFPLTDNAYMLKYKRYLNNSGKFDKRNLFNAKDEQIFVGILEAFSLICVPITRKMFLEYVASKLKPNKQIDLSGWLQKFLQRHKDRVAVKTLNGIKMERVTKVGYNDIEKFAVDFERVKFENQVNDECIFNVDETRISINMDKYSWKAIESCSKLYYSTMKPNDYTGCTYIPFLNRNRVFMHIIILPDQNGKGFPMISVPRSTRRGAPLLFIAYTKSGYLNGAVWAIIMKKFCEEVRKHIKSSTIILLLDNLKIHTNCESIAACSKSNIISLFFPRYSSHFMQPADDMFFLNIKRMMKQNFAKKLITVDAKESLSLSMINIVINIHKTVSEDIIMASWENTCIIPFNKAKMLERAKKKLWRAAN